MRAVPERTALIRFSERKSACRTSNPNQFMAIGITQISEIGAIRTDARRVLDRGAAVRDAGFVPRFGLRRVLHLKADRAAVRLAGGLAVDRLRHHEPAAIVRISQPASGVRSGRL